MAEALIATLGSEAQVVTIVLDLLAAAGHSVAVLRVIHTDARQEPTRSALARLRPEIAQYPHLDYREVAVTFLGEPLADIENEPGAQATFATIYEEARRCKVAGHRLHICVAGGRKVMAVYGMTTAQLLFDEEDRLWHLVSFGALLAERRMHLQTGDRALLIPIPVLGWSDVPATLTEVGRADSAVVAVRAAQMRKQAQGAQRVVAFVEQTLTPKEREVARLGTLNPDWTYEQIALFLGKRPRTVDSQLQAVYRKLEEAFGIQGASRGAMMRMLGRYWREDLFRGSS